MTAVEVEHDDLEQSAGGVESQAELAGRVVLVWFAGVGPVCCGVQGILWSHTMLECRGVDLHAT